MPLPENKEEVQVLKIPVPLRVADFQSKESLDLAFKKGCSAVLKRVPSFCQNEVTLSKTFTALGGRNIHTITVVASSAARPYFDKIRTKGIELLGKTVFSLGHSAFASSNRHNMYPRKVNIKFHNLPFICSDDEATKLLNLPPEIENIVIIDRKNKNIEGVDFYTGEAQVRVGVRNERQLKNFTRWSYEMRTKNEATRWNGIPVLFHAPSLHMCEECKKQNRRFQGHHKDWCFLARQERLQNVAKMTSTIRKTSMPQSQAVESQDKSQDESQDGAKNVSQDESQAQEEPQEEPQEDSQDESQIEEEVETLAEGILITAQAHVNTTTTTTNELEKVEKQRYVPPEERCRRAAERENDEEDTRRLSLSNFPPLSNSRKRIRMLNKQRN